MGCLKTGWWVSLWNCLRQNRSDLGTAYVIPMPEACDKSLHK